MRQYLSIIFFILIVYQVNGGDFKIINQTSYNVKAVEKAKPVFQFDSKVIIIKYMESDHPTIKGLEQKAGIGIIYKNSKKIAGYVVYIHKKLDSQVANEAILHEFIHLYQIEKGELVIKSPTCYIFQGVKYNPKLIPYPKRPWEIDARKKYNSIVDIL